MMIMIVQFHSLNYSDCSYEGLFYVCLCCLLFSWLEMETRQTTAADAVEKVSFLCQYVVFRNEQKPANTLLVNNSY